MKNQFKFILFTVAMVALGGSTITRAMISMGEEKREKALKVLNKALSSAVLDNNVERVKQLLDKGAYINTVNKYNKTPLYQAAEKNHPDMVKLLLARGADINAKGYWYDAPLHGAVISNYPEMIELLLSKGADVNLEGEFGWTALHRAVLANNSGIVSLLLGHGATMNTKGGRGDGSTPLDDARAQHFDVIVGILEAEQANKTNTRAKSVDGTPEQRE